MQRLINRDHTPPDGFRWVHPTGYVSKAIDIYNWMQGIWAHEKANGLPHTTEEAAVDTLCKTLPPGWCEWDDGERSSRSWVNTRLRWSDIAAATVAYAKLALGITQPAPQEEANRRAKICSSCYLRVPPTGCGSCVKMGQVIVGDVASRNTPYDDYLVNQACAVCECPVKSIVHFPLSELDKVDSPEKQEAFPTFCWRKQGGTNRVE